MKVLRMVLLLYALPLFLLAPPAEACITCHDLQVSCDAYKSSTFNCDAPYTCVCVRSAQNTRFETDLHPGFSTMQSNGKLIVSRVIPGSPAEHAGILADDIIVLINFNNPSSQSCEPRGWELSEGSKSVRLLVRRDGFDREMTIPLTPVNSLLSERWISEPSYSILRPATLRSGQRLNDTPGPFLIGVRLAAAKNRLVVTAVLLGSPADRAGVRVGDTILTVDQKPAALLGARALDDLTSNDHRYTTQFRVQRGTLIQDAVLRAVGVSEILRDLGTPVAVPAELSASAAY